MKRGLLALAVLLLLADLGVVAARTQRNPQQHAADPLASFASAIKRHDYKGAYELTDLGAITVSGGSSAISLPYFVAFERAHPLRNLTESQGVVHVPTTNLRLTAPTGPLPSLAVDGVAVSLLTQRVKGGAAAAWRYTYVIVVISGPHALTVGPGPVTAGRSLTGAFRGDVASMVVALGISSDGDKRVVEALDSITRTCSGTTCLVAPCTGHGPEYVLDAWGIGTPPIVARALVGDQVVAPMPPNGWSIAITFLDQGQPPGLRGPEQTKQLRARYVFGFAGQGRAQLLDRCWVSAG